MAKFIARYYPLKNGKEKEYKTIVFAKNKNEAKKMVRDAFVDKLSVSRELAKDPRIMFIGYDGSNQLEGIDEAIEYGKTQMRIEISLA